jgi:hypothetical protein
LAPLGGGWGWPTLVDADQTRQKFFDEFQFAIIYIANYRHFT